MDNKISVFITTFLLLTLLGAGCTQTKTESSNEQIENNGVLMKVPVPGMEGTQEMMIENENTHPNDEMDEHMENNSAEMMNSTKTNKEQIKEFIMTAKKWEFDPRIITVNNGDTVQLHITSMDVEHGFMLPDFNINKQLHPNQTTDIEFVADKIGTFTFSCNVFCGTNHSRMNGSLIVE